MTKKKKAKKIICDSPDCETDITNAARWYLYPLILEGDPAEGGLVCIPCARKRHPELRRENKK